MTLAELLQAMSVGHFMLHHFGVQPLHVTADGERFAEIAMAQTDTAAGRSRTLLMRDIERTLDAPVGAGSLACRTEAVRLDRDYLLFQTDDRATLHLWQSDPAAQAPDSVIRLTRGELAYVPRGWWLSGLAAQSAAPWPAIVIRNPNGRDLLAWLSDRIELNDFFDRDLPRFAAPGVQAEYLADFRRMIAGACKVPGLIPLYTRSNNSHAPARASLGLERAVQLSPHAIVDFLASRRIHLWRPDAETIAFKFAGKDLHFPVDAAELIAFLEIHSPVALEQLQLAFADEFEREDLANFVADLERHGLVAILMPTDG